MGVAGVKSHKDVAVLQAAGVGKGLDTECACSPLEISMGSTDAWGLDAIGGGRLRHFQKSACIP